MNEFEIAYKLNEDIKTSIEYKKLKEIENIMLNDSNAFSLIKNYQSLEEIYASNKLDSVLKKLHEAKLQMDLNPLVIEYKQYYKEFSVYLGKIEEVAFDGFLNKNIIDEIERIL